MSSGRLFGLKARRADLLAKLQEFDDEIALAERWLGKVEMSEPTKPRTLQDAMALVLREDGNTGVRPRASRRSSTSAGCM
jgi:hypothetical protein